MKKCIHCKVVKPLEEFYRHPQMADGRLGKCKQCQRENTAINQARKMLDPVWREKELERHREKSRKARAAGKKTKADVAALSKAWAKRNPHKKAANTAVNNAIRDGRLVKAPCEKCGELKAQAHHDDYSKPLDVRWLCVKHHNEHHVNERRAKRLAATS